MKGKIEDEVGFADVHFFKIGQIRYLRSKNYKKGCCQICGKKRKTTAHHIIPRRLRCICPLISEIRVRVCLECEENLHPENKFIKESDVIKSLSQNVSNLKEAVRWRNNKMKKLEKGIADLSHKTSALIALKDEDFYKARDTKITQKEVGRDDR